MLELLKYADLYIHHNTWTGTIYMEFKYNTHAGAKSRGRYTLLKPGPIETELQSRKFNNHQLFKKPLRISQQLLTNKISIFHR